MYMSDGISGISIASAAQLGHFNLDLNDRHIGKLLIAASQPAEVYQVIWA